MPALPPRLGSGRRPVAIEVGRIDRQLKTAALAHAGGSIADEAYLTRVAELRTERASLVAEGTAAMPAARAIAWLRAIGQAILIADLPDERADLVHAIYERITVAGPTIISARLTPAANAHGLVLTLPQVVMARPTGVGRALATYDIPIEGRDEWVAAARRLA